MNVSNFLQKEFENRRERNLSYSKRAYSRDLGLSQSFTIELLNNKSKLSEEKAYMIAKNLGLNNLKTSLLLNLVRFDNAKNKELKKVIKQELDPLKDQYRTMNKVSELHFRMVSSWFIGPILNLIFIKKGKLSKFYIAEKLNLTAKQVHEALENMLFLGLIKYENERYVLSAPFYEVESVPSIYIKKYHHAILEKAKKAIDQQSPNERDITGISMPFHKEDLESVKQDIKDFIFKMSKYSSKENCDQIYHLGVQFFRLNENPLE